MGEFKKIYKKIGGTDILKQYWHAHVLLYACMQVVVQGTSKKSLEIVRLSVSNRILSKIRKKYKKYIKSYMEKEGVQIRQQQNSNKVWVCWLQGIENAPSIVRICYKSLKENLLDRDIILLTEQNYREYVAFPDYIQEKIDNKTIGHTHMSDLLRTELLINYGGTWVDSTVFCSSSNIPEYMMDSELFVFQCLKPGLDGHCTSISNWFMSACTNHPILLLCRALMYEYWRKNNYLIDYFIYHDMFQLSIETYPESWKKVIPFSNSIPHILLLRMFETFDESMWNNIKSMTPFHKLSYKFSEAESIKEKTYYRYIVSNTED